MKAPRVGDPGRAPERSGPWLATLRVAGRGLLRLPRAAGLLLAIGWMALIWYLSEQSFPQEEQSLWQTWISNMAHAPLFGLLGLWWLPALLERPPQGGWPRLDVARLAWVLAAVLAFAILDEWHQAHTPGRDPSWADIVTDLTGATSVVWVAAYLVGERASERGLRLRLGIGVLACAAAGLAATLV